MGFFKKLGKSLGGGLDLLSATFSHPVTATKGYSQLLVGKKKKGAETLYGVVKKTKKEGAKKTILRTVRTTAVASAVLLGAGTTAGRTIVSKALIPKSIGGIAKIPLAVTGVTVLAKSKKARKTVDVATDPSTWVKGGEIIGETIETGKPPVTIKQALVGGGLIAGAVVGGVAVAKGIKKIKEDPLIFRAPQGEQLITEKPLGIEGETPILPETTTISPTRKAYKRRRAKKTPSVRQSVRINIVNKSKATGIKISKRYLKQELLC